MVNPVTVDNFSFLFNCTPAGQTSASLMVVALKLIHRSEGSEDPDIVYALAHTRIKTVDFFSSGSQLYVLL